MGLRALSLEAQGVNSSVLSELFTYHDSLVIDKRKWSVKYDSLLQDTLRVTPVERALAAVDAALWSYSTNPSAPLYTMAKGVFQAWLDLSVVNENYERELNAIMLEVAINENDYAMAYSLQNKIHAANYADWKSETESAALRTDSLLNEGRSSLQSSQSALKSMSDTAMQWHLIAMAAILLFVVLVVVFFISKNRWNKQRNQLSTQVSDKSEEEALVNKLEAARREIQELKQVAKKTLEVPVVAEVAPLPQGKSLSAEEVADWNNQVQAVLAKIKTHCEAGKNSMAVPTYMSIINDVTRLGAQVNKKSEEWIQVLSRK
jgi:outer membrane murein-binding lipoprotein Lpp